MEAVSLSLAWWCYSWHTLVSPWITHTANLVLTVLHMKWCWTVQTRGPQAVPFWVTGMRWPISTRSWDRTGGIIRRFCRWDSKSPSFGTWKSPQNGTIGSIAWFYKHLYSKWLKWRKKSAGHLQWCRLWMILPQKCVLHNCRELRGVFDGALIFSAEPGNRDPTWHVDNRLSGYHSYTILMGIPSGNLTVCYWKWPLK